MIIGVTGGVGSGKSTILDILKADYKAHIILADEVARELMKPSKCAFQGVIDAFGDDVLSVKDGEKCIDRIKLSNIVFKDRGKLKLLNSIIHPLVRIEIHNLFDEIFSKDKNALIILESAILIEAGYKDLLDYLWFVYAKKEVRISRLINDRGYSRERCENIIDNQLSDDEYRANCDFVIDNSLSLDFSREQIVNWFNSL